MRLNKWARAAPFRVISFASFSLVGSQYQSVVRLSSILSSPTILSLKKDDLRRLRLGIVRTPIAHALPRSKHILKFHIVPEVADSALLPGSQSFPPYSGNHVLCRRLCHAFLLGRAPCRFPQPAAYLKIKVKSKSPYPQTIVPTAMPVHANP